MKLHEEPRHPNSAVDADQPPLAHGVALHQDGRLDEAASVYREILSADHENFDATHLLGVVALQQGHFDAAQRLIQSALAINPRDAAAMGNLGTSYLRDGKLDSALRWFETALDLQPDSVGALINVGTALHHLGRYRDAVPILRRAHAAQQTSYAACNVLGACLMKCGEAREAADVFTAATEAEPGSHDAWVSLSRCLNDLGQYTEALECAYKAVALNPRSSTALGARGAAQFSEGRLGEALESYRQAADLPDPSSQMLVEFGSVLMANGLQDEAIEQLRRTVKLDTNNLNARWALVLAHLKPIYESASELVASRAEFAETLDEIAAWYHDSNPIDDAFNAVGIIQPFYLAYQPFNNRDLLSRYGTLCATWMKTLPSEQGESPRPPGARIASRSEHRKLRIGIATAQIYEHSVWIAITKGWVDHFDRTRFELYLFQLSQNSDRETDRVRRSVDCFEDEPTDLSAWIDAIRDKDLDVLIYPEIGMHPLTLQLASLRLATVQAASWGHPETTGLPTMDLYLSADALEPPNAEKNYSEKLVRLPKLGVYVEPLAPAPEKPRLRSLNLPRGEPLLLCPGAPFKYSPLYDEVWVGIARHLKKRFLRAGGGGRLVFFRSRSDTMDRALETRLRAAFADGEVDFDAHVSIIPTLSQSRFFGLMRESALMLDTPGFSGFNTALQSIECGLPIVAYEGDFMRGRLASALMRRLDLAELVATTPDDFIQKAIELAADGRRRQRLESTIAERRDRLFHDLDAVRALESHLEDAVMRARTDGAKI